MNDKGVCKTAPATPGLLNIYHRISTCTVFSWTTGTTLLNRRNVHAHLPKLKEDVTKVAYGYIPLYLVTNFIISCFIVDHHSVFGVSLYIISFAFN